MARPHSAAVIEVSDERWYQWVTALHGSTVAATGTTGLRSTSLKHGRDISRHQTMRGQYASDFSPASILQSDEGVVDAALPTHTPEVVPLADEGCAAMLLHEAFDATIQQLNISQETCEVLVRRRN